MYNMIALFIVSFRQISRNMEHTNRTTMMISCKKHFSKIKKKGESFSKIKQINKKQQKKNHIVNQRCKFAAELYKVVLLQILIIYPKHILEPTENIFNIVL